MVDYNELSRLAREEADRIRGEGKVAYARKVTPFWTGGPVWHITSEPTKFGGTGWGRVVDPGRQA